jgi:hypothetical protein
MGGHAWTRRAASLRGIRIFNHGFGRMARVTRMGGKGMRRLLVSSWTVLLEGQGPVPSQPRAQPWVWAPLRESPEAGAPSVPILSKRSRRAAIRVIRNIREIRGSKKPLHVQRLPMSADPPPPSVQSAPSVQIRGQRKHEPRSGRHGPISGFHSTAISASLTLPHHARTD